MPVDGTPLMRMPVVRGIVLLMVLLFPSLLLADSMEEIRVAVASRLFPSMLAADEALEQRTDANKQLTILVIYLERRDAAERAAAEIRRVGSIRKIKVDVRIVTVASLSTYPQQLAGIFIADRLESSLPQVIAFAQSRNIITFSPYRGDVEQGVAGGILVRDRILPYINLKTLREASITLRPFYLKVAETYEPK